MNKQLKKLIKPALCGLLIPIITSALFGCNNNKPSASNNISASQSETQNNENTSVPLTNENESKLAIYIDGAADLYIYDSSGNKVSSVINADSYSDFDDNLFYYTYINRERQNLYIPNGGYKLEIKFKPFTNAAVMVKIVNSDISNLTIAAADFADITTIPFGNSVVLDSTTEITKDNIETLTLLGNSSTIEHTEIRTDYAESLTVDRNKNIPIGETEKVNYSVLPESTKINWQSSDESVATVDSNGVITAINYGYAIISATTSDGNITENCYICVPCNAESIEFTEDYTFVTGAKYTIEPSFTPEYATNTELKFTSSDTSVISVNNDEGILKAESAGKAVITAETDNGKTASIEIEVVDSIE